MAISSFDEAIAYTGKSREYFTKVKADYLGELLAERFDENEPLNVLDVGCGMESSIRFWSVRRRCAGPASTGPSRP